MTAFGPLLLTALVTQSPAADSLRSLAVRLPESALVVETRSRPLAVREAVTEALRRDELAEASKLAAAYAVAWQDSFLVREVARFAAWPPERRTGKLWADSVRRAGIAAFARDGPSAAIAIWRRAWSRAVAVDDTAAMAAVLGNIGAGFVEEGRPDSAESYLERARGLALAIGDIRVEANAVGSLGDLSAERGDLATARERYTRALALRERIGDSRGVASVYNNLGLLAQTAGDVDEARRQFEAALAINRRDGRDEVAATNLVNLAGLASLNGDFATAERSVPRRARDLARARAVGRRRGRAARSRPARAAPRRLSRGPRDAARGALDLRSHRADHRRPGRRGASWPARSPPRATCRARWTSCAGSSVAPTRRGAHRTSGRASPCHAPTLRSSSTISPRPSGSTPRSEFLYRQAGDLGGESRGAARARACSCSHRDHTRGADAARRPRCARRPPPGTSGRPR